jgi:hypothetical protein
MAAPASGVGATSAVWTVGLICAGTAVFGMAGSVPYSEGGVTKEEQAVAKSANANIAQAVFLSGKYSRTLGYPIRFKALADLRCFGSYQNEARSRCYQKRHEPA